MGALPSLSFKYTLLLSDMLNLGILNEITSAFISREKQTTVDVVRGEEAQQEGLQGGLRDLNVARCHST